MLIVVTIPLFKYSYSEDKKGTIIKRTPFSASLANMGPEWSTTKFPPDPYQVSTAIRNPKVPRSYSSGCTYPRTRFTPNDREKDTTLSRKSPMSILPTYNYSVSTPPTQRVVSSFTLFPHHPTHMENMHLRQSLLTL